MIDPSLFFRPGSSVLAVPSWRSPRILLAGGHGIARRWRESSLLPAFRPAARVRRGAFRILASLGACPAR